jgi:hypothetical protein
LKKDGTVLLDLFMANHWINKFGIEIEGISLTRWLYENHPVALIKILRVGMLLLILYEEPIKKGGKWCKWQQLKQEHIVLRMC